MHETRLFIADVGIFTAGAQCLSKHQQWRAYARFPTKLSKTRGPNTSSSPSRPCSSSPSSSSAPRSSYSKAAFVGWYLGKLESWPLITKSISSSLIYTAADLTSQVKTLNLLSFLFIFESSLASFFFEIHDKNDMTIMACTLINCVLSSILGSFCLMKRFCDRL